MESETFYFLTREDPFTKVPERVDSLLGRVTSRLEMKIKQGSSSWAGVNSQHCGQVTGVTQHPPSIPECIFHWIAKSMLALFTTISPPLSVVSGPEYVLNHSLLKECMDGWIHTTSERFLYEVGPRSSVTKAPW